jgi:hypothetical protein
MNYIVMFLIAPRTQPDELCDAHWLFQGHNWMDYIVMFFLSLQGHNWINSMVLFWLFQGPNWMNSIVMLFLLLQGPN